VKLLLAGKTRWAAIVDQNERFVRLKPALVGDNGVLQQLINDDDIDEAKKLPFDFSSSDWAVMQQVVDILSPFRAAIRELEGDYYPTLPLVLKHVYTLNDFVGNRLGAVNRQRGAGINERVATLLHHLRAGLGDIIDSLPQEAYFASLLDPRFLDSFIPQPMRETFWADLDAFINEMWSLDNTAGAAVEREESSGDEPALAAPPIAGAATEHAAAVRTARGRAEAPPTAGKKSYKEMIAEKINARSRLQAAVRPYRELVTIDAHLSASDWWRANRNVYPKHANAARRLLAIPATSAPCERLFSTGGRILEKRRASLSPESVRDIVLVHDNLNLLDRVVLDDFLYDD
jgi:hypothetical protein